MNADAIAFVAAPYGFGPSSKAIAISSHLPRSVHRVFFSDGPPLEMARRSGEFSNCAQLDFSSPESFAARLLSSYQVLVFVNSTRFIPATLRSARSIILVETLGWLRTSRPTCSQALSAHFAQRFFDHPFSADLQAVENFHEIGAVLPKPSSVPSTGIRRGSTAHKQPVVHCGGLFSPAMYEGADHAFIRHLLETLDGAATPFRIILPKHLHTRYVDRLPPGVSLIDCSPLTVQQHVDGSLFSLTTSGIEFTYESLFLGVPTIFLPPFNASQYLQLKYHDVAHSDWIPFHLNSPKMRFDFARLHEATFELQKVGVKELWPEQFAEVRRSLQDYPQQQQLSRLERLRDQQDQAVHQVGAKGAHTVASYALRELERECALQ